MVMVVDSLRIRFCEEGDLPKVYEIERISFKDPYPLWLLKFYYVISGDLFLVADVSGRVVGYVIGLLERGRVGHVISIAVHPKLRGKGIGERLLRQLLMRLKAKGARLARLEVRPSNKSAIALYKKMGFKEVKLIPRYYEDGEACIVMELSL